MTKAMGDYALVALGAPGKSTSQTYIPQNRNATMEMYCPRLRERSFLRSSLLEGMSYLVFSEKGESELRAYVQVVYFEM